MKGVLFLLFLFAYSNLSGQGLIFNQKAYDEVLRKPFIMRGDDYHLPPNASLKEYCPKPGNQVNYATSVAWAIGWAGKTILYAKNNNLKGDDILPYIFSPAYIYQKALPEDSACSTGITLTKGLSAIKNYGTPLMSDFLYFCQGPISGEIESKALENRITDYTRLFNRNDDPEVKIESIKTSLKEGYPVVAGVIATPSFTRAREFWQPTEDPLGDHMKQAVCIIGYDDEKYGGAFEIINSWGKSWGNEGFMWIRYEDVNNYIKEAFELFELFPHNTKIAGSIEFVHSTGDVMPVEMVNPGYFKMKKNYSGGEAFRIYINNDDPGFLYVFGSDLTNEFFQIFPHEETISAVLNYKQSRIAIPDENNLIQFDHTAGTDYLCVLYSREELDLKQIMEQMKNAPGEFDEKMNSVLTSSLLNNDIEWLPDKVAFQGDAAKGNVVAVIVEINHL